MRLLADVRRAQRRNFWLQGAALGGALLLVLSVGGGLLAASAPSLGRLLVVAALPCALGLMLAFGVLRSRTLVGDDARTARLLTTLAPQLQLDLLAAVELSKALGEAHDFSPELARAFLRDVDARAATHDVRTLVTQRGVQRAFGVLALVALLCTIAAATQRTTLSRGLTLAFASTKSAPAALRREPITGDFEVTYRPPAYSGIEPQTVTAASGELRGLAGTEVDLKTRADRDVGAAVLMVNDQRVPMTATGRALRATFVLDKSGSYHVAFVDGARIVAEGPDLPIQVEADQPPQVHLSAPVDELEVDDAQASVSLKFEATDDYGVKSLELAYHAGADEKRVNLKPDDGRATRGRYEFDLRPLGLKAGDTVTYFLEAADNDTVHGPKKGTSQTQTIKVYSAAEHKRAALEKAEKLWERLVLHLADRLESGERTSVTLETVRSAQRVDEQASMLSGDLKTLGVDLLAERDPPEDIVAAVTNIGAELARDTTVLGEHHKMFVRLASQDQTSRPGVRVGDYSKELSGRITTHFTRNVEHAENHVLYLESLLDRMKMEAIRELARELQSDRRELSRLVDEYSKTKDDKVQQALLEQMQQLRERMNELQRRMAELSKHMRSDEFANQEAVKQMMESRDFDSQLDEVEQLIREGKGEDALKKMQELGAKMDKFLEDLDKAEQDADQQADPELARRFEEFSTNLDETTKEQERLADKTKQLRDKYRDQAKQRIEQQGAAMKKALTQKLEELQSSLETASQTADGNTEPAVRDAKSTAGAVKQALEADDFDLAAEVAERLEQATERAAASADEQARQDDRFQSPPDVRRESKQLAERLQTDGRKAADIAQQLRSLFPPPGSQLSEADKQQLNELSQQQRQAAQRGQQLEQQMNELAERAPIFDEEAKEQMRQAGQRMGAAGQRLQGRDPQRGLSDQQGALQSLQSIQQKLQQQAGAGGKGGLPMPMKGGGQGRKNSTEKVEIPNEDPNTSGDYRKDVMDAMKQGAPDRYREQNQKYYEELVK